MSAYTDKPTGDGKVLEFARPPIRQSTVVNSACEPAFDVFVRRIAEWWPLIPFSRGHDRVRSVDVEERVGGQIVETWDDGTTWVWGDVLEFDEPSSFVMTWNVTGTPTVVELRFARIADGVTRVELEHRGWEHLSEAELGDECAVPGGYLGGAFHHGWQEILSRFKDAIDTTAERTTHNSLEGKMIDVSSMTDDRMMELVGSAQPFTVCALRPGPNWGVGDWEKIIWEHGRRNLAMREEGILVITLRTESEDVVGIGVYNRDVETAGDLLSGDPAIQGDVLRFDLYPAQGFPGDALPR